MDTSCKSRIIIGIIIIIIIIISSSGQNPTDGESGCRWGQREIRV